jgi:glycosyltransferase involved in cell wall biosynthesis
MKVLMLGRMGLLDGGLGGDFVQVQNTAMELRKLGVEVDIRTDLNTDMSAYDLVHIFQLDWISENYFYAKKAKEFSKPIVLSPIHHSVTEVKKFDDTYVFDYRRVSKFLFRDQFARDTFKNLYRALLKPTKLKYVIYSIVLGLKNMHKVVLQLSDYVLVQTKLEVKDLEKTYGVPIKKWKLVLNGVGEPFLDLGKSKNPFDFNDYVICVGRIEPRKNQLSIIEAMNRFRNEEGLDTQLVLVGKLNIVNHFEYTARFKKLLKKYPWIHYLDKVPYENIPAYFHFAKVGVSASWFETTGLTSLDALFCGTNAVASGDRAKEYLGDTASYCIPDNINSIKEAIKKEYYAPRPTLDTKMKKEYTWKNAAKQTLEVYNELLGTK